MSKVTINMPATLKTTRRERETLKNTFQTKLQNVLRRRPADPQNDIWGVRVPDEMRKGRRKAK